jgi:L-rhamnonate dehydratase
VRGDPQKPKEVGVKIKEIRVVQVDIPSQVQTEGRRDPWVKDAEVANPMSRYPKYKRYRPSWMPKNWGSVWVQVIAEDGTYGLGQTAFGRPVAAVIEDHFAPMLVGRAASLSSAAGI